MELTIKSLEQDKAEFEKAGIVLPKYDVRKVHAETLKHMHWLHMGPGNIFNGFIASLAQKLLDDGDASTGIGTISCYDGEAIKLLREPHDNLVMNVTLLPNRDVELEVLASVAASFTYNGTNEKDESLINGFFESKDLQMLSYTITEKGYALKDLDGSYKDQVEKDFKIGPNGCRHAMSITASLLYRRYKAGAYPIAVVSMDNCSHNGSLLKASVLTVAKEWEKNGLVDKGFVDYLSDETKVSFPWTMIDKITPRPDPAISKELEDKGLKDMESVKTSKGTFIAPFVNAEKPQYLVIEDKFPNGRPALEKAGVLFTTGEVVDLCERMKVTTCLNPLHTALAVYGCILGYERISAEMDDPLLVALVNKLGYQEGLPVVDDPKILSPKAFLDEVIEKRLPNKCLPDSPQRIATDTSMKVQVRFGETIKNYIKKGLDLSKLTALPLAIAGWLRYLLALDDEGKPFELSDDPQLEVLTAALKGIVLGNPDSVQDKLQPILSNAAIFGVDLVKAGLAPKIEALFKEEIAGPGAVKATLAKYLK